MARLNLGYKSSNRILVKCDVSLHTNIRKICTAISLIELGVLRFTKIGFDD